MTWQPGTIQATLYTRAGCHLCEAAIAELDRLRLRRPHQLALVDVSANPELERRYGERIPVLVINGREYAAPLPPAALERALAEARCP
jgi:glutaredoxin